MLITWPPRHISLCEVTVFKPTDIIILYSAACSCLKSTTTMPYLYFKSCCWSSFKYIKLHTHMKIVVLAAIFRKVNSRSNLHNLYKIQKWLCNFLGLSHRLLVPSSVKSNKSLGALAIWRKSWWMKDNDDDLPNSSQRKQNILRNNKVSVSYKAATKTVMRLTNTSPKINTLSIIINFHNFCWTKDSYIFGHWALLLISEKWAHSSLKWSVSIMCHERNENATQETPLNQKTSQHYNTRSNVITFSAASVVWAASTIIEYGKGSNKSGENCVSS